MIAIKLRVAFLAEASVRCDNSRLDIEIARGCLLGRNLNDGMSWGIFPLFFAAFGLGVERIGILKAIYPAVWGILQTVTGPLSDRFGRKGLYVGASSGLVHDSGNAVVRLVAYRQRAARTRHCHGLSHPYRRGLRCIASVLACAVAQCVPVLARSRLCDRRPLGRHNCDLFRAGWAIAAIGVLTLASGAVVAVAMRERSHTGAQKREEA